ncbi:MAG: hypothetical protein LQ346_005480 [Caloplaca aetnensis]|nr:MAG: hypothetical protein LQ346_005480 [Caloplaca aetnensis]
MPQRSGPAEAPKQAQGNTTTPARATGAKGPLAPVSLAASTASPPTESIRRKLSNLWNYVFFSAPVKLDKSKKLRFHHLATVYHHLFYAFILPLYCFPWICILTWWTTVLGCGSHLTRHYVEEICLQPYASLGYEGSWRKDLWDNQMGGESHGNAIPAWIEATMTSHLTLYNAEESLLRQKWMLRGMSTASTVPDELYSSLGKLQVPNAAVSISNKLTGHSGKDSAMVALGDLGRRWDVFSQTFYIEKDNTNHAYRALVEGYETVIISDRRDIYVLEVLFVPGMFIYRLIKDYFQKSFLLRTALYSPQVKAEVRFRMERFLDEAVAALERIDLLLLTTSDTRVLEATIATTDGLRHTLEEKIGNISASTRFFKRAIRKPQDLLALEKSLALVKHIRENIVKITETAGKNEAYSRRLKGELQDFRQRLGSRQWSDILPTGWSGSLGPSFDRVDPIDSAVILASKSNLAQVCRDRDDGRSFLLHTVCLLNALRVTILEIDDDLGGLQKSWLVLRRMLIHRYELKTGTDLDSQVHRAIQFFSTHEPNAWQPAGF